MARIAAVLSALWTAVRRDIKSIGSFSSNNFFIVAAVFLFLGDTGAFVSLNVVVLIILFFPLSTDPLSKIPGIRLALWPLTRQERWLLRIISPWLNPITWLVAALAIWRGLALSLWAAIAGLFIGAFAMPSLLAGSQLGTLRMLPNFPGPLNQLVRKDLRQIFSSLDFYSALGWSVVAGTTRASGEAGMNRYRLLPVRGWQILMAKDAAFLLIAALLTAPLSPIAGLSAAFTALAVGHYDSVKFRHHETRWRFRTSVSFGRSMFQVVLFIVAGVGAGNGVLLVLPGSIALYAASTWWFGRALE